MGQGAFRVLFLIENVPYSLDTRVRREAQALKSAGGVITVIAPRDGRGWAREEEGVRIYQYPKPAWGAGFLAHLAEYVTSVFFHFLLTAWVAVRRGFDVIHVANPPDLLWLVASPYRLLGKRFIFDHHDLVPELFEVRFGDRLPALTSAVRWLERCSVRFADHVISTNETFRHFAISRDGKAPSEVSVVRNGPWISRDFPDVVPDRQVRQLGQVVVGYLGIMNPQDHLDRLLEAARIVESKAQPGEIGFIVIGSGDAFESLRALRDEMGLEHRVVMPGTLPWRRVIESLAAVDICVQPDPPTAFNRHLTMNKLMEYMALGKCTIAYDMPETRYSGGEAVHYLGSDSPESLADAILSLARDPARRQRLGRLGRERVETSLAWEHQVRSLLDVYGRLLPERMPLVAAERA